MEKHASIQRHKTLGRNQQRQFSDLSFRDVELLRRTVGLQHRGLAGNCYLFADGAGFERHIGAANDLNSQLNLVERRGFEARRFDRQAIRRGLELRKRKGALIAGRRLSNFAGVNVGRGNFRVRDDASILVLDRARNGAAVALTECRESPREREREQQEHHSLVSFHKVLLRPLKSRHRAHDPAGRPV